jgi:hypothetical protein
MKKIIIIFLALVLKNSSSKTLEDFKKECLAKKWGDEQYCDQFAKWNCINDPSGQCSVNQPTLHT